MKKILIFAAANAAMLLVAGLTLLSVEARAADAPAKPIAQPKSALLGGTPRGICYSGFRHGQHPDRGSGAVNPTDAQILEDLRLLVTNRFHLIRLYDSQENSEAVLKLIRANGLPLKVLLGAWLDAEVNNPRCPWLKEPYPADKLAANKQKNALEVENAIRLANTYSNVVVAVAVGNEALVDWNDHMVPVESVIGYVRRVKKSIPQPVTVADNYDWWAKHGAPLAREVDFLSVHTYPAWENKDIDEAMPYSIANIQAVRNAFPDKRLVITEAGWATVAREFGPRASVEKQKRYYDAVQAWADKVNITTFFFEAFDEDWKGDVNDPQGAEKHWGIFDIDRKPKAGFATPK
jgi:exo-beta-1,3-glucanase (GH17 family)